MSLEMIAPRNYTLRTKSGHTVKFLGGVAKMVPDDIVSEALAVNILPVEGATIRDNDAAGGIQKVQITGLLRQALILRAIDDIFRENDVENFDAGSRPKTNVINERSGLGITAKERTDALEQYKMCKANQEELPKHKALDTVLAVQSLNTPSDMKEYATLLEIPQEKLTGLSLREQKQVLLAKAVKG